MTAATAAPNQPFKVGGNPSNHTCALHKLRWGSDPTMDAAGEKPEASPSQKTGLVRSATRAGLGGHHSQSPQKKGGVCPRDLDAALTKAVADGDRLQFDRPLPNDYGLARPERQMSKSASETSDAGGWGFYKDCEGTPGDSAYVRRAGSFSDESRRRRGCDGDIPWRARSRRRRGCRGDRPEGTTKGRGRARAREIVSARVDSAAAATWIHSVEATRGDAEAPSRGSSAAVGRARAEASLGRALDTPPRLRRGYTPWRRREANATRTYERDRRRAPQVPAGRDRAREPRDARLRPGGLAR